MGKLDEVCSPEAQLLEEPPPGQMGNGADGVLISQISELNAQFVAGTISKTMLIKLKLEIADRHFGTGPKEPPE